MKFIRLIAISAVVFFLVVTGFSLFIPSTVRISRATNVAPGKDYLLQKVCNLNEWQQWHPQLKDVVLKDIISADGKVIKATANGIGLSVIKCTSTEATIHMQKGRRPVENNWVLIKHGPNDSLTLQNFIEFEFKWYPWEKFSSLLLEKSYGPVMEMGLNELKNL